MQVQFVRLLEMNGAEIEDEVRRALDENPALEATDSLLSGAGKPCLDARRLETWRLNKKFQKGAWLRQAPVRPAGPLGSGRGSPYP